MKTVKVPYFQGDEVPLKFKVTVKSGDAELSSARVSVFNNKIEVIHDAPCDIEEGIEYSLVKFTIPPSATEYSGDYRADFTVHFSPNISRTHIIRFHIAQKLPVVEEAETVETGIEEIISELGEGSDDYEVSGVVAQVTRKLRRAGHLVTEAARAARDLAENMTGRRI